MTSSETMLERQLLSGNEAVALAARHAGVALGVGYPGTPSTEILEAFSLLGGRAQWSPNEKVALEVAAGAGYAHARVLVTMKHVGLNVAADALFTLAYTGCPGGMVIITADDPGMASSQNEQDNRRYAQAAGVPMLEPSDSQEAYDLTRLAIRIGEQFSTPVLLRMTTRICHSKTVVQPATADEEIPQTHYQRDIPGRVMIPAYARPAHHRLREKLAKVTAWNHSEGPNRIDRGEGDTTRGIVTSGISYVHAREADPQADILKLGMTYPLPMDTIRAFAAEYDELFVIEEGDPCLLEALRTAGLDPTGKAETFRFGELNVERVRRILAGRDDDIPAAPRGKPPQLCPGCPHRTVFQTLHDLGCIVTGDIGCYSLGVLPPFEAMDTLLCMGASIGVGLGMRHTLPDDQARRVVSVIGDSTFIHSGLTGIVDMVYTPPPTGHVVLVLDNQTTAMTGLQEHPATGRKLDHTPAPLVRIEDTVRAIGVENVTVIDPSADAAGFRTAVEEALASGELCCIVARRPCILSMKKLRDIQDVAKACGEAGA